MTPVRIQLRRTRGWRMPPNTVNRREGVIEGLGKLEGPICATIIRFCEGKWPVNMTADLIEEIHAEIKRLREEKP